MSIRPDRWWEADLDGSWGDTPARRNAGHCAFLKALWRQATVWRQKRVQLLRIWVIDHPGPGLPCERGDNGVWAWLSPLGPRRIHD